MSLSENIKKAQDIIHAVRGKSLSAEERSRRAVELAAYMLEESQAIQTFSEKQMQGQLSRMMNDPIGKIFTNSMTDQCFRSQDPSRVADQLIYLLNRYGIPRYLSFGKRAQLFAFKLLGSTIPGLLIPLAKEMLRRETSRVIIPGEKELLIEHMKRRRKEGVRLNLNHLGEAILGEEEALSRLDTYIETLLKPEVEYVSVKISTIYSQINLRAWDNTVSILTERLKKLYRAARDNLYFRPDGKKVPKFVNLDMEEYRDLDLTVDVFCKTLDDPEFHTHSAGIVLQSYLPDSFFIQKKLTEWAKKRVADGGAPIKIRIVKGANLAMEKVEGFLKDWPQAPYMSKVEVDANYKRMVTYGCDPHNASSVYLGIGSHNLFDIAYAMLLRSENRVEHYISFEMLEGMADHMRRVVQQLAGDMLLYCPVATKEEFQNAVAYLIRRLDENTAPDNFLRYTFGLKPGTEAWKEQSNRFLRACQEIDTVSFNPRRTQDRSKEPVQLPLFVTFENEADTDWSLLQNRQWAEKVVNNWKNRKHSPVPLVIGGKEMTTDSSMAEGEDSSYPGHPLFKYSLATSSHIDQALEAAGNAAKQWSQTSVSERSLLLAKVAQNMRRHRGDLIGAMVANTGKTVYEADVEISEAIDFAEYYRRSAEEIFAFDDIQWSPKGTVLVAPPWNFPCSIPAGGVLAALATGNCVIFKPAPEAVLVGWQLAQIFWESGISKEVLQFITCEDEPVGSQLVQDPRLSCVVLTGATSTAKLLLKLRPGLDLVAETGGKNALIISNMSDRDLAVRDLVQSAFGHAGQKCSACSLAICFAEVYDDPNFRKQLHDAAKSWTVGSQWNPETRLNPLIRAPNPTLMRGLTTLDEGEEWLLQPEQDYNNPNLWSPGIKLGVKQGSFTHQNELFGPVLGVMRADNLAHALELANGTPYGLTSGLHSLDQREQDYWIQNIEAGNCYINRGITGAIVQRQPFGGCKQSSFGPGGKAGGPNYLMQLLEPRQISLPTQLVEEEEMLHEVVLLKNLFEELDPPLEHLALWDSSTQSYMYFWEEYFSRSHDPSCVLGQDNFLCYVPHRRIVLRVQPSDEIQDVLRVIAAAEICGTFLEVSGKDGLLNDLKKLELPHLTITLENEEEFTERLEAGGIERVRLLSQPSYALQIALANVGCNVILAPVLANGRVELLHYLREMSLSIDYHRYGNLGERELEDRDQERKEQLQCGASGSCGCC